MLDSIPLDTCLSLSTFLQWTYWMFWWCTCCFARSASQVPAESNPWHGSEVSYFECPVPRIKVIGDLWGSLSYNGNIVNLFRWVTAEVTKETIDRFLRKRPKLEDSSFFEHNAAIQQFNTFRYIIYSWVALLYKLKPVVYPLDASECRWTRRSTCPSFQGGNATP